ncbi:unnamed protein product [Fusarium graminearum]|nr:unnamed protein product [Fusarium graminearum]
MTLRLSKECTFPLNQLTIYLIELLLTVSLFLFFINPSTKYFIIFLQYEEYFHHTPARDPPREPSPSVRGSQPIAPPLPPPPPPRRLLPSVARRRQQPRRRQPRRTPEARKSQGPSGADDDVEMQRLPLETEGSPETWEVEEVEVVGHGLVLQYWLVALVTVVVITKLIRGEL